MASVAQSAEHLTRNEAVFGSSPNAGSKLYVPQPHTPAKASTEAKRQRNVKARAVARRALRMLKYRSAA